MPVNSMLRLRRAAVLGAAFALTGALAAGANSLRVPNGGSPEGAVKCAVGNPNTARFSQNCGALVTLGLLGSPSFPHFGWAGCIVRYQGPSRVYSVMADSLAIWPWRLTSAGPILPLILIGAALVPFAGPIVRHFARRSRG